MLPCAKKLCRRRRRSFQQNLPAARDVARRRTRERALTCRASSSPSPATNSFGRSSEEQNVGCIVVHLSDDGTGELFCVKIILPDWTPEDTFSFGRTSERRRCLSSLSRRPSSGKRLPRAGDGGCRADGRARETQIVLSSATAEV